MANHPYHDISVQLQILTEGSREDLIRWLQWNDGNGVWTDDDCEAEEKPPLTLEEARSWMLVATDEERTGLQSLRNLSEWQRQYRAGEKPSGFSLKKQFNSIKYQQFPWMKDIHRDAHAVPFANLDKAHKAFFKKKTKRPVFKKKGRCRDSFAVANDKFRLVGKTIVLPKVGKVRLREELRFVGKVMGAVVSRTADRWFVSVQVDVGDYHKPRTGHEQVGVDLGLKTALVLSQESSRHGHLRRSLPN